MKKNLIALALATLSGVSIAGDVVTDLMQEAYQPYRVALFKTNSNSQTESQQAMQQATAAWSKLAAQFAAKPAAPYDRDSLFAASVAEVSKVYALATEQVNANKLTEAHETLEHARDVMAEMRRRNQVVVYSDTMNAYHSEMEHVLIDGPKILTQPQGLLQLTAMSGTLTYLSKRLVSEAPVAYSKNAEFVAMVGAVEKSVAEFQAALFSQDPVAVKAAIGRIKVPYSKLFLKFG